MEQQKSGLHGPALSERVQDGDTKSLTGAHAQECDANEGRRAEPPTSNTLKQYKFSILFMTFQYFSANLAYYAHVEAQSSVL